MSSFISPEKLLSWLYQLTAPSTVSACIWTGGVQGLSHPTWSTHQQFSDHVVFTCQEDVVCCRSRLLLATLGSSGSVTPFPGMLPRTFPLGLREGWAPIQLFVRKEGTLASNRVFVELCSLKKQILDTCWSWILLVFQSMTFPGALLDPCGDSFAWGELLMSACLQKPPPSSWN